MTMGCTVLIKLRASHDLQLTEASPIFTTPAALKTLQSEVSVSEQSSAPSNTLYKHSQQPKLRPWWPLMSCQRQAVSDPCPC